MNIDKLLQTSNKWDRQYRQAVVGAIRRYQPERAEKIINRYLSRERCAELNLTNTYARKIFRHSLLEAAQGSEAGLFRRGLIVMWASFVDRDWACCDRNIDFDYQLAKQKLRNAFAGWNFIGVIEPGYYPEIKWKSGDQVGSLVSFHAHVVVWDTSRSKLQRHRDTIRPRFTPVVPGDRKTGRLYHVKTLKDLLKVLRYSTKMPCEGYDREIKDDDSVGQTPLELAPIHHYRLFKFMRKHSVWDAWLAGGDGAKLLRSVRKETLKVARRIEVYKSNVRVRRRKPISDQAAVSD